MITTISLRECFLMRDTEWTKQLLVKAHNAGQNLYESQNAINTLKDVFLQMSDDVNSGIVADNTIKDYCYELLGYCDLSNDWRDWPQWAERIVQNIELYEKIWVLYGIGRYFEEHGKYIQAMERHKEGLVLCESLGNRDMVEYWRGSHFLGIGIILQRTLEFFKAEEYLKQAVSIFRAEKHLYKQADALANLASCYDREDKRALSIAHYEESLSLLRQINNQFDLSRILYSVGIAYISANQFTSAESALRESQKLCKETGNDYSLALSHYGLTLLYYRLTEWNQALIELEKAFKAANERSYVTFAISNTFFPEALGNMYMLGGALCTKLSKFDIAERYLSQAELLYKQIDSSDELLSKVLANRARLSEQSGDLSQAEDLFCQLIAIGKQIRLPLTCGDAGVHLIRIFRMRHALLAEWVYLIRKLGWYGIYGTILAIWERRQRALGLRKLNHKASYQ